MQTRSFVSAIVFVVVGIICIANGAYAVSVMFLGAAVLLGLLWYYLWSRDQRVRLKNQRSHEQSEMVMKQRKPPMSDPRSRRLTGGSSNR